MRKKTLLLIFCILISIHGKLFASTPGPYIGANIGWADAHQGDYVSYHFNRLVNKVLPNLVQESSNLFFNNTGLAGGIYIGNQFNDYFAVELGWYHFSNLNINARVDINFVLLQEFDFDFPVYVDVEGKVETYIVDLLAKGIWPVTNKFSLYGKLGIAYINVNANTTIYMRTSVVDFSLSANPSANIVYPAIGIGMSYDITSHLACDFSWLHIQQFNHKYFPNIDFISVGAMYRFL